MFLKIFKRLVPRGAKRVLRNVLRSVKGVLAHQLRKAGFRLDSYVHVNFNQHQLKVNSYLIDFFKLIENIPGEVVECGFGEGSSFLILASKCSEDDRNLTGFDSFKGFPSPTEEDNSPRNPKKGEWSVRTLDEARLQIQHFGLNPAYVNNKIRLVAGYVEETLHKNLPAKPIALLHIDLDLYSAYKCTLEILFPLVAEGGIVLFDEYNVKSWPGAKLAVDEYFRDLPFTITRHSSGKYYVKKQPIDSQP
jgi:O-methyltransferase